jgi:hypothetical protein
MSRLKQVAKKVRAAQCVLSQAHLFLSLLFSFPFCPLFITLLFICLFHQHIIFFTVTCSEEKT